MSRHTPPDIEQFKDAQAATLRAISGKKSVEVYYSPAETVSKKLSGQSDTRARLSIPPIKLDKKDRDAARGEADAEGLRIKLHNATLHQKLAPKDDRARIVYDALETARIEALGAENYDGIKTNLNAALEKKCTQLGYHQLQSRRNDTMADALHAMIRSELSGSPLPENAAHLVDLWRGWISEKLGESWQTRLKQTSHNQKAFVQESRNIMRRLELLSGEEAEGSDETEQQDSPENSEDTAQAADEQQNQDQDTDQNETSEDGEEQDPQQEQQDSEEDLASEDHESHNEDSREFDDYDDQAEIKSEVPTRETSPGTTYPIYTTQFDEIVKAEEMADTEELYRLRALLDKQLVHMQPLIAKLANRLQRKLLARQQRSWLFDLEEGYLDTARLARVIANPSIPLTFKQEKETEFKDTIVTLLLDNSGSMRGRPITIAAMCADILSRTLERCGIKVEILGFTTRTWKGGNSRDLWIANGRPDFPGRLNDLRHIIYKSADQPMRRARKNLGLMLKEGLLKENIDGEALVWAYNRIVARSEERKILIVISDGAPVDDSTLSVNPATILEADLRHVINWIETIGKVDLTAIGIGHDVTRYYQRAIQISDASDLGEALITNLSELFDK
ncbi:MAG: cobaltochelatase subunit CobT [Pseudobdellovibrionaceae bacterium]|nr:cobaltochelatase subunit CobT [Pseudobdellovibrionaceae bacterium]